MQNSLSAPQLHDLGRLSPGRHTLTICVDNTYKIPIGTWTSAISEDTQGMWNGIIGRIELRATDPVGLRQVQVYPTKLMVIVGKQTDGPLAAEIQSQKILIPVGGGEFELPFMPEKEVWNEFTANLHSLTVTLRVGNYSDAKTATYAVRDLAAKDE